MGVSQINSSLTEIPLVVPPWCRKICKYSETLQKQPTQIIMSVESRKGSRQDISKLVQKLCAFTKNKQPSLSEIITFQDEDIVSSSRLTIAFPVIERDQMLVQNQANGLQ